MMERNHATIPLLHDSDGSVMDAYRLSYEVPEYLKPALAALKFPDVNPKTGWRLLVPATYVIDRTGVVRSRHANGDYTRRMEPGDIINALEEIQAR